MARVYVAVFNLSSDKQKRVASEGHFLSQAGKCAVPRQCQETCTKKTTSIRNFELFIFDRWVELGWADCRHYKLTKKICISFLCATVFLFGQIVATSHDPTPKGSWTKEIPLFQWNLGWLNITIWPDSMVGGKVGVRGSRCTHVPLTDAGIYTY